jgi:superfamily II DNA/RNA helicase
MKSHHKRDKKRKRQTKHSDSSEDDAPPKHGIKKAKEQHEKNVLTMNQSSVVSCRRFVKSLWEGPAGEAETSEETKQLRKNIGVLVKGNCDLCPLPTLTPNDSLLPPIFQQYCQQYNITKLTSVQMQCWPAILNGTNMIAISPTGSGKTLSFALPAIAHILAQPPINFQHNNSLRTSMNKVRPYVLVVAPARELAIQIHAVFKTMKTLSNNNNIKSAILYGGQEKEQQLDNLRNLGATCKVLVATPGRLLDILHNQEQEGNLLDLSAVSYQVIDEADRMLAMGFVEQLQVLSSYLHPDRQLLMFSATFPGKLREISQQWLGNETSLMIRCNTMEVEDHYPMKKAMKESSVISSSSMEPVVSQSFPEESESGIRQHQQQDEEETIHNVDEMQHEKATVTTAVVNSSSTITVSSSIKQHIHICAGHKRPRLLIKFIEDIRKKELAEKQRQADGILIFCNQIKTIKFVQQFLTKNEHHSVALHSHLPQQQREQNLLNFKSGKVNLLIATDVAARGIHIKRLKYVINYDFPGNIEQYCHRIGRCGRQTNTFSSSSSTTDSSEMNKKVEGVAYSLMTRNYAALAKDLINLLHSVGQEPEKHLLDLAEEVQQSKDPLAFLLSLTGEGDNAEDEGNNEEENESGDEK